MLLEAQVITDDGKDNWGTLYYIGHAADNTIRIFASLDELGQKALPDLIAEVWDDGTMDPQDYVVRGITSATLGIDKNVIDFKITLKEKNHIYSAPDYIHAKARKLARLLNRYYSGVQTAHG